MKIVGPLRSNYYGENDEENAYVNAISDFEKYYVKQPAVKVYDGSYKIFVNLPTTKQQKQTLSKFTQETQPHWWI